MIKYILFIADLHLSPKTPETKKLFENLINEITPETDALYILGDLFQFWVGDDDRSEFNEKIKNIIKKISEKIPVYIMPGNRDFLLGKTFAKESGSTLIPDPYPITLYGKKTLLTHGDLLCTKNIKYRVFRTIIRIPFGLKIFLSLPLKLRTWIAKNIQQYSHKSKQRACKETLMPQLESTKKFLSKYESKQIIHGHIHIEETEEFTMNGEEKCRISLGAWDKEGNILIYKNNHAVEFKNPHI